ncbi:MAG TPA: hypothetical protein VHP58_00660 [Alphaproteobacteria bacterium]|nr:hypothetical protein [Alphaproteobacteria bacterium]
MKMMTRIAGLALGTALFAGLGMFAQAHAASGCTQKVYDAMDKYDVSWPVGTPTKDGNCKVTVDRPMPGGVTEKRFVLFSPDGNELFDGVETVAAPAAKPVKQAVAKKPAAAPKVAAKPKAMRAPVANAPATAPVTNTGPLTVQTSRVTTANPVQPYKGSQFEDTMAVFNKPAASPAPK